MKDIYVDAICFKFNVNPTWLKMGVGEMFNDSTQYSLDQYAELHNLTPLELDIIKTYMEIDENARKDLLDTFSNLFFNYKIVSEIENQAKPSIGHSKTNHLSDGHDILIKDKDSVYVVEVKNYIQDVGRVSREKKE